MIPDDDDVAFRTREVTKAWCSVAPRPTLRPLGGPEADKRDEDSVWSLVCFFVTRRFRHRKRRHVMRLDLDG